MTAANKKRDFEAELKKLETIVSDMEQAELGLDDALKLYEKGMELSRFCLKHLEEAETRVEMLNRNGKTVPVVSAADDVRSEKNADGGEEEEEDGGELLF